MSFTVKADEGYRLSYLLLDGQKVFLEGDTFTFEDIRESHTVLAHFSPSYGAEEEAPVTDVTPEPQPVPTNSLVLILVSSGAALLALIAATVAIVIRKRKKQ